MDLPAFIKRLTGHADSVESTLAQISAANTELSTLREKVSKFESESAAASAAFSERISAEQKKLTDLQAEHEKVKAELEAERVESAKNKARATEVIASQGVSEKDLPTAANSNGAGVVVKAKTLTEQCLEANRIAGNK